MKKTNSMTFSKGAEALALLTTQESKRKTFKSTTADVAIGALTFKPFDKVEITLLPWSNTTTGKSGEFPAIVCTDSAGEEHAIALSAFQEKRDISLMHGTNTITCNNVCGLNDTYTEIAKKVCSLSGKIILNRVSGFRNNYQGTYEYFTVQN